MIARDPVTIAKIQAIHSHPAWSDGRYGFQWCRFDALLTTDDRHLRAEITWDDDSEFEGNEGQPQTFFDADLWIETNRVRVYPWGVSDELETLDGFHVPLTFTDACRLLASDPADLLTTYADQIATLKVAPPR